MEGEGEKGVRASLDYALNINNNLVTTCGVCFVPSCSMKGWY